MTSHKKTFYIHTLGCKVNWCDSDAIVRAARAAGWEFVDDMRTASVCIVNTCAVTTHAEATARKVLRRIARANPKAARIVVGCYARTATDDAPDDTPHSRAFSAETTVVPVHDATAVLAAMETHLAYARATASMIPMSCAPIAEEPASPCTSRRSSVRVRPHHRTRSYIKIQDGCAQFCAYCKVPFARGVPRSVEPDMIFRALETAAQEGVQECVLTGVNLGQYASGSYDLAALVREIDAARYIPRLRLSSIEPQAFTPALYEVFSSCSSLMPHVHIPIQSGSTRILREMNRPLSGDETAEKIRMFLTIHPLATVSTDCMVGFPGETDEDFADTCALIDAFPFAKVHVFRYSRRPGTRAAEMKNPVPQRIARERELKLIACADAAATRCRDAFRETTFSVLIEEKIDNAWQGYTENYLRIATTRAGVVENTCVEVSPAEPDTEFVAVS